MQEVYQAGLEQEEIDRAVQQERERACSWPLMILTSTFVLRNNMVDAKQDHHHFIWPILPRCKLGMPSSEKVFIRVLVE
jgi:hypothetical protein